MFFAPPTVWIGCCAIPDFDKYDLSSLKKVLLRGLHHAGGGAEGDAGAAARRRVYNYYGQTELAPYHTILKAEDAMTKLGSAGMGGLNMETRLEDDFGNPGRRHLTFPERSAARAPTP
jgi:fatty-acyl-CoA synthase